MLTEKQIDAIFTLANKTLPVKNKTNWFVIKGYFCQMFNCLTVFVKCLSVSDDFYVFMFKLNVYKYLIFIVVFNYLLLSQVIFMFFFKVICP